MRDQMGMHHLLSKIYLKKKGFSFRFRHTSMVHKPNVESNCSKGVAYDKGGNDITGEKLHHFQSGDKEGTERLAPGTIVQFWKGDSDMLQRAYEQKGNI